MQSAAADLRSAARFACPGEMRVNLPDYVHWRSRMRRHRALMVLAAACAGVVASAAATPNVARAAAVTWDAGGTGGLWSDNANWSGDVAVAGNDAKFADAGAVANGSTAVTNTVDGNTTVNSLAYNQ